MLTMIASFSSANSSGASLQQGSRPRLVAKSASGLRDSAPKSKNGGNRGGPGGPDPIQVWNKNRRKPLTTTDVIKVDAYFFAAVVPTPPKHLTDEELKQQYGIHMTSRIQADGDGKGAAWADIDDDEDDWAPETIEWNDGTKITLTQTENLPVAALDPAPAPIAPENQKESEPTKPIVAKPSTSIGPNATVLKLGGSREGQQAKGGSLSLKGTTDKTGTNSSKSTPAPPSKSPWAALPPVDKVAPVTINPPMPIPPRQYQRDGQGYEQGPGMQQPAREMAADDFNRNWREGQQGLPRELFNSQSGRYEPVNEGRRGSRNDQHFRPPSLLQRPTQNEQSGPAEPSAAFQTNRTSQDGMWNRRRNSSNVSGGSGSFGRRMSLGKPPDLPSIPTDLTQQRRGSQQIGPSDRVGSPRTNAYSHPGQQRMPYPPPRDASPAQMPQNATLPPQDSPASQYTQPESPAGPNQYRPPGQGDASAQPQQFQGEDPVQMQQRIMREKREEARKRRQEQEEREEAEKRERIRLKLEAMGPPPSSEKKEKPVEAPLPSPQLVEVPTHPPPKPPVPEAKGEPMQYGMMKVHHPESVRKMTATNERIMEDGLDGSSQARRVPSPSKPEANKISPAAQTNGIRPPGDHAQANQSEHQARNLVNEKMGQPWNSNNNSSSNVGGNVAAPWGGARIPGHPSSGGNLWGPPTHDKDRALGNGTFDRTLTTFSTREIPLRNHLQQSPQAPLAMHPTPDSQPAGPSVQQPFVPSQSSENFQSVPTFPSPEKRSIVENSEQDHAMQIANPGPIGPPSGRPIGNRWQPATSSRPAQSGWNNFHSVASREEAEQNQQYQRELAARLEEEHRTGIRNVPPPPPINETFRQVEIGDDGNSRNVVKAYTTAHNLSEPLQQVQGFGPVGSIPSAERPIGNASGSSRGSRFFPHQGDNVQSQGRRAASYSPGDVLTPSSPPPEVQTHPVFDGDIHHPIVNLPHPKPVVKLPTAAVSPPATATTVSPPQPSTPSLRLSSLPIASTVSWQDRFNGLLGKKTSPEKKNDLAVTSATKEPLEDMALGAAVSLPKQDDEYQNMMKDAGKVTSKDVEDEEAIFEDREAGSLPIIRLGHIPLQAAWLRAVPPTPPRLTRSKLQRPVQVLSAEPFNFGSLDTDSDSHGPAVVIHVPGMATPVTKPLPRKLGQNNNPRQRNTSSTYNNKRGKGTPKSRETSGSYNAPQNGNKEHASGANGSVPKPRGDFRGGRWAKVPSGRAGH
jgi:hypothetical protein